MMEREQLASRRGEEGAPQSKEEGLGCRKDRRYQEWFYIGLSDSGERIKHPLSLALVLKRPCQRETGSSQGRGVTQGMFGSSGF